MKIRKWDVTRVTVLLAFAFIFFGPLKAFSAEKIYLVAVCKDLKTSCAANENTLVDIGYHHESIHCAGRANFLKGAGRMASAKCYECKGPKKESWFWTCEKYVEVSTQ